MRHSSLSCVLVPLLAGAAGVVAACTATGSETSQHGPAFDDDAGRADAAATRDGSTDAERGADGDAPADAGASDAFVAIDAGRDAQADAPSDAPADAPADAADGGGCSSTMAIVAGGASTLSAASFQSGQWSAATSLTGSASSAPAVIAFGGGFRAVVAKAAGGALVDTGFASSWSSPVAIGTAAARESPALAVVGAGLHLVYQGQSDYKFYHGTSAGGAWDAATDPVGSPQSFGPSGPSVAAAGTKLAVLQGGSDGILYDQTWDGAWQAAHAQAGTSVEGGIRPTLVALVGGAADLLAVYVRKTDRHLIFSARSGAAWSQPAEVYNSAGNVAYSNDPVSIAALPGGHAVLAFLGGDGKGYFSVWNAATWSAPAAIAAGMLASPPGLASGVCGDDAIAALVLATGEVNVTKLAGATWSAPTAISGATGMKYAGIATRP